MHTTNPPTVFFYRHNADDFVESLSGAGVKTLLDVRKHGIASNDAYGLETPLNPDGRIRSNLRRAAIRYLSHPFVRDHSWWAEADAVDAPVVLLCGTVDGWGGPWLVEEFARRGRSVSYISARFKPDTMWAKRVLSSLISSHRGSFPQNRAFGVEVDAAVHDVLTEMVQESVEYNDDNHAYRTAWGRVRHHCIDQVRWFKTEMRGGDRAHSELADSIPAVPAAERTFTTTNQINLELYRRHLDWLRLLGAPKNAIEFLERRLQDPSVEQSQWARELGLTRQAVSKALKPFRDIQGWTAPTYQLLEQHRPQIAQLEQARREVLVRSIGYIAELSKHYPQTAGRLLDGILSGKEIELPLLPQIVSGELELPEWIQAKYEKAIVSRELEQPEWIRRKIASGETGLAEWVRAKFEEANAGGSEAAR